MSNTIEEHNRYAQALIDPNPKTGLWSGHGRTERIEKEAAKILRFQKNYTATKIACAKLILGRETTREDEALIEKNSRDIEAQIARDQSKIEEEKAAARKKLAAASLTPLEEYALGLKYAQLSAKKKLAAVGLTERERQLLNISYSS